MDRRHKTGRNTDESSREGNGKDSLPAAAAAADAGGGVSVAEVVGCKPLIATNTRLDAIIISLVYRRSLSLGSRRLSRFRSFRRGSGDSNVSAVCVYRLYVCQHTLFSSEFFFR